MLMQAEARLLGRSIESAKFEDTPEAQDRHQDVIAMDAQVVDPSLGYICGLSEEVWNARTRHLKGKNFVDDCPHRRGRFNLDRGLQHVALEDHVEVLVGRDPDHDAICHGIVRIAAGVPVRDPRRKLLEGNVCEAMKSVWKGMVVALL